MSKIAAVGQPAPDFELPATGGKTIRLSDLRGRKIILYFYPKDSTPGCTQEGRDFRDAYAQFQRVDTEIFGISRDSLKSHESFKAKQELPFDLLSDPDETVCRLFNVIREKNLYGKKVMGVERSTFLIDSAGVLRREWRRVKVDNHAAEVLKAAEELSGNGSPA